MTVYANTLNAYAARLKAQRRAAQRQAEIAANRKSADQRAADKAQREADKKLRQASLLDKFTPSMMAIDYLDKVSREFKTRFNLEFLDGERARATKDIKDIAELYFYTESHSTNLYKAFDLSNYSMPAFNIIVSVLANMRLIDEADGLTIQKSKKTTLVIYKTPNITTCALAPKDYSVDEIKNDIKDRIKEMN